MKDNCMIKNNFFHLSLKHLILASLVIAAGSSIPFPAQASNLCKSVYSESLPLSNRLALISQNHHFQLSELVLQLRQDGKLMYRGKHKFKAGTEFLASNEFDWLATPFDHKP